MKRTLYLVFAIFVLVDVNHAQTNILQNPGFESQITPSTKSELTWGVANTSALRCTGFFDATSQTTSPNASAVAIPNYVWFERGTSQFHVRNYVEHIPVHSGDSSLTIYNVGGNTNNATATSYYYHNLAQKVSLDNSKTYRFKFFVQRSFVVNNSSTTTVPNSVNTLRVGIVSSTGATSATNSNYYKDITIPANEDWNEITVTFDLPTILAITTNVGKSFSSAAIFIAMQTGWDAVNLKTLPCKVNVDDLSLVDVSGLTAAVGATVDAPFDVTFIENAAWRGAITSITVDGNTLDPSAYNKTVEGKITFTPSVSALLQTAGMKTIVVKAAGGYADANVSQTIWAGFPTANSTANIDAALANNASSTITCTAKDQYNNLVPGYTLKYDVSVINSDATAAESYTIDGLANTSTVSDVNITATTNASGVATFTVALPSTIDGGDGLSVRVQLANGLTNIGPAFTYTSQTFNLTGTKNSADLVLNGTSDINVSSGELIISSSLIVHSVIVAPGAKLTLGSNTLNATNGITFQSDASGTATMMDSYTTPTVNATVKQYIQAGRNWYLSSPISAGSTSNLNLGDSVVQYNETIKKWEKITGSLTAGRGYIQAAVSGQGTTGKVEFNGTTNSGDVSVTLTRTESGSSRGFNLVGNPYPSYLDWSLVTADPLNANISSTLWFRTKNAGGIYTFATHNGISGETVTGTANTTITKLIPPMQAFWVHVNPNVDQTTYNTSITFKNGMRNHRDVNENKLKAPKLNERKRLRLLVSNGTTSDETMLYFDANAQDNFDNYDSPKMFNNTPSVPEIYTQVGAEKLVINGQNEVKYDTEIPIGFVTGESNDFSIKSSEMTNFEAGTQIILKDKLNPTAEIELDNGVVYNFSAPVTSAATDRFSILFRAKGSATGVGIVAKINAQVFVNSDNYIVIESSEKGNMAIYNVMGQKQYENILNSKKETIHITFGAGVYLVELTVNGQREIQKVIIR
jgi:hypothetical protein